MAVGLSLKKEKYNDFKLAFEEIAKSKNIQQIIPVIKIDSIITAKDVNKKTIQDLEMLEPFGEKNKNPIFVYKNLKIDSIRALSEEAMDDIRHGRVTEYESADDMFEKLGI